MIKVTKYRYGKEEAMIQKAAHFALKAHEGVYRKGGRVPYSCHPMEVAFLVSEMTTDEEVIAAAYLHDILEDTNVSKEEIEQNFGKRVLGLVEAESENKAFSWYERKQTTITHLKGASKEVQIIALADKLSNMRDTAQDYLAFGDQIWNKFNEKDKSKHEWYHRGILASLVSIKEFTAYQEYERLCNYVF